MGQIKFAGGILLTGLFAISLITFAVQFASENDASYTLDSEQQGAKDSINSSLTLFSSDINTSSSQFTESEVTLTDSFSSGQTFKGGSGSSMSIVKSALQDSFGKIFGFNSQFSILFTSLISFLVLVSFLYVYKTWVGRNPD